LPRLLPPPPAGYALLRRYSAITRRHLRRQMPMSDLLLAITVASPVGLIFARFPVFVSPSPPAAADMRVRHFRRADAGFACQPSWRCMILRREAPPAPPARFALPPLLPPC